MKTPEQSNLSSKWYTILTFFFATVTLWPVLYNRFPIFRFYPDFEYVMAKVNRILEGSLFVDPVSGIQNFHPPYYHVLLAPFHACGIPLDYLLWGVTILNIALMYVLVFKIIQRLFDANTAMITVAMLPFINEFMGCGYILLPTAPYIGLTMFLAGLWFFLSPARTNRQTVLFASLWGLTFLISPAYLFPIGFAMLYELLIRKNYRQFKCAFMTLVIFLIPFFYQAYVIFSNNLFGTSAFAFWRGIPDIEFISNLVTYIVNPTSKAWSNPLIWAALAVTVIGLFNIFRRLKKGSATNLKWFVIFAVLAYWLTFYHFKPQYAIRIHFFISIFVTAYAVSYLFRTIKYRQLVIAICAVFVIGGYVDHFMYYNFEFEKQNKTLPMFNANIAGLSNVFEQHVSPDEYIVAYHLTYRHYIMPHFPAHALKAYKSGEYYQLTSTISKEMQVDYERLMNCTGNDCLNYICDKYDMTTAVVNQAEINHPLFKLIARHWQKIYSDQYFKIYRRP